MSLRINAYSHAWSMATTRKKAVSSGGSTEPGQNIHELMPQAQERAGHHARRRGQPLVQAINQAARRRLGEVRLERGLVGIELVQAQGVRVGGAAWHRIQERSGLGRSHG
jgi:hypothetical protein